MKLIVFSILLLFFISVDASEKNEFSKGVAKDKSGNIVYIEKHTSKFVEGNLVSLNTEYFDPSGSKIGYINTNYNQSFVPDYEFFDSRNHRKVILRNRKDLIYSQIQSGKNSNTKNKTFEQKDNMVAGQGLHAFLIKNLHNFLNNKGYETEVKFLIPLNKDYYNFSIRYLSESTTTITLRLESSHWFLKLLAPQIDVTYDKSTQRLVKYKGPSNLLDSKGQKINVTIKYEYEDQQSTSSLMWRYK
ncbi:MAG: hypothetical protein KDD58_09685 [Bdellovibrionales bacterium]|nr:hypothetical protein [Bdellovibrionales bacterium]